MSEDLEQQVNSWFQEIEEYLENNDFYRSEIMKTNQEKELLNALLKKISSINSSDWFYAISGDPNNGEIQVSISNF